MVSGMVSSLKVVLLLMAHFADAGSRRDALRHRHVVVKQAPAWVEEGPGIGVDWKQSKEVGGPYDPEWMQSTKVNERTTSSDNNGMTKQEKDMVPVPYLPPELVHAPTQQPATRAQDFQECALVRLPLKFKLVPRVESSIKRAGVWENDDGATFLGWQQDHFSFGHTVSYFDGAVPFFDVTQTSDSALRDLGLDLPPPANNAKVTTLVAKDCQGVLMYVFREHHEDINQYEVYNRAGEFLAGSVSGQLYHDQIHWYDQYRNPIAIAQSPFISTIPNIDKTYEQQRSSGVVKMWELEFIEDYGSNSSILRDQYRWVLGAALQTRAIREADMGPSGEMTEPWIYQWFVFMQILLFLAFVYCIFACFQGTYHVIYQPPPKAVIQNPYLRDFSAYGALERR